MTYLDKIAEAAFDNSRPVAQACISLAIGVIVGGILLTVTVLGV